ncbi:PD-(D/E)XK nuclease family protein [Calothrix sp. FACHB-1219]|uniref:PD-(D/E)XK nuclease family protein n=1 Tax=unclassified Calothrix TaxID=2619626 RepID=UPI001689014F|nr:MULTISPECIES: PD-(D/E)XK nuclease family protein [unclassified Calothrix]MBD2201793.1 PD-(D/E)XK nuclease family protein [Calothrix sp. FACHB-168]MBD2217479.1 PD-(D/E)XK nuclease family protein [Calothrix sp. FACHB-1219]
MIINSIPLDFSPKYYSVSRLKTYSQCSEYYRLKYVENKYVKSISSSTLLGSLCHRVLEELYSLDSYKDPIDLFNLLCKEVMIDVGLFDKNVSKVLLDTLVSSLISYSKDVLSLYNRASGSYIGKDAIRTKDGKVPLSPQMTSTWKDSEKAMNLPSRRDYINRLASQISDYVENISLCEVFGESYYILSNYTVPSNLLETLYTELPISKYDEESGSLINPVLMPDSLGGEDSIYLNAFIDWIGRAVHKGKEGIAIVDYKSSKEELDETKIKYNVQLYSYVYAFEKLTGLTVDFIGIHNLRTNNLYLVDVDRNGMNITLDILFGKHKYISKELFSKHVPDSSYSPCLSSFGKKCIYIEHCYPDLADSISEERKIEMEIERITQR